MITNFDDKDPNGKYGAQFRAEVDRPLYWEEMDFNLSLIGEIVKGYRVLGQGVDGEMDLVNDENLVLKFYQVQSGDANLLAIDGVEVGDWVWIPGVATGAEGPQGFQGWQGFQGPQGLIGPQGVDGDAGIQGPQGNIGTDGAQGFQGDLGIQGAQGNIGNDGFQGDLGPQGRIGFQGAAGTDGAQGIIGAQGFQGVAGAQGDSDAESIKTHLVVGSGTDGSIDTATDENSVLVLYQVQSTDTDLLTIEGVELGDYVWKTTTIDNAVGTQGPQGADGADGTQGPQGIEGSGAQGPQGADGADGVQGPQGIEGSGAQGPQGADGADGVQGPQGIEGTQGFQGDIGAQGSQGIEGAGAQGPQGIEGVDGVQGPQGIEGAGTQGPQGIEGTQGFQGDIGVQGLQGDIGVQGLQGDIGVQGPQGDIGVQGPQGIEGTQGFQGFQGVEGPQGIEGANGVQGPQGIEGTQGFQGVDGPQGAAGVDGVQGPQGIDGTQGFQGWQGVEGPQGLQGPQGIDGTQGFQGWQGVEGPQGLQGPQGIDGTQGFQGWQGVEGPQGVEGAGTQGLQGLQGPQGIDGTQGFQGWQGVEGPQGLQGPQGIDGTQGFQGWQGVEGPQGVDGLQGPQGPQGFQGVQGAQGWQGADGLTCKTYSITPTSTTTIEYDSCDCDNEIKTEILLPSLPCNSTSSFSGNQSYPAIQPYNLGTAIGTTQLNFDALSVPDRFIVYYANEVVIDTGYRGNSVYNIGGSSRTDFTSALNGRIEPISGLQYPLSPGGDIASDGYPFVVSPGNGAATFEKTYSNINRADVYVYAPMGGTVWNLTLDCPGGSAENNTEPLSFNVNATSIPNIISGTADIICLGIASGTNGINGLNGAQGPQGVQGTQGWQGIEGAQGWQGIEGTQGWQGFQGIRGVTGVQGVQGAQGWQGDAGIDGIQGTQGWQGFQGIRGVTGVQGVQGPQGWQGFQGFQGPQGWQGFQGVQGLIGVQSTCETGELLPDTDIFAIFDDTGSMLDQDILDIETAVDAWFAQYQLDNPDYTGNLYKIATNNERWLAHSTQILNNSGFGVSLSPPAGFTTVLPSWWQNGSPAPITSLVLLTFVNESETVYHDRFTTDFLTTEPTTEYIQDITNHINTYNALTYFKGVIYPVVPSTSSGWYDYSKSFLLHSLSAVKGTTQTASQIQAEFGVNYDTSTFTALESENPYETAALTPLKDLGWYGIWDKNSPVSASFTAEEFALELNDTIFNQSGEYSVISLVQGYDGQTLTLRGLKSMSHTFTLDNTGCIIVENVDGATVDVSATTLKAQFTQASHGFAVGNVVAYKLGTWYLANADDDTLLGRAVVESVVDANTFVAVYSGLIQSPSLSLTTGAYYVAGGSSTAQQGELVEYIDETNPSFAFSNPILQALTPSSGHVLPWRPTETGNFGPQGPQGWQGDAGTAGVDGLQGPQGWQGDAGTAGVDGLQGFQGFQGDIGTQGTQGVEGTQGFQGIEGPQGLQGPQGIDGVQGFQGWQGVEGFQGTQGVEGTQGFQGIEGTQGPQGIQGCEGVIVSDTPPEKTCAIWVDTSGLDAGEYLGNQGFQGPQGWQGPGDNIWNISGSNIYYNAGNVGIGINPPAEKLHVVGNIVATGDIGAFYSSDIKLKDNLEKITGAIDKINQINGYTFDWKDGGGVNRPRRDMGVIAQEIEKIAPEVVTQRDNGYLAVKYEKMIALLIEGIKELSKEIEELKKDR